MIHSIENPNFHVCTTVDDQSIQKLQYQLFTKKNLGSEEISCGPLSNTLSASNLPTYLLFSLLQTLHFAHCERVWQLGFESFKLKIEKGVQIFCINLTFKQHFQICKDILSWSNVSDILFSSAATSYFALIWKLTLFRTYMSWKKQCNYGNKALPMFTVQDY